MTGIKANPTLGKKGGFQEFTCWAANLLTISSTLNGPEVDMDFYLPFIYSISKLRSTVLEVYTRTRTHAHMHAHTCAYGRCRTKEDTKPQQIMAMMLTIVKIVPL